LLNISDAFSPSMTLRLPQAFGQISFLTGCNIFFCWEYRIYPGASGIWSSYIAKSFYHCATVTPVKKKWGVKDFPRGHPSSTTHSQERLTTEF